MQGRAFEESKRKGVALKKKEKGGYQSGQMGQTVNLLSFDFGGSNPSPPTSVEIFAEIAQLIEH